MDSHEFSRTSANDQCLFHCRDDLMHPVIAILIMGFVVAGVIYWMKPKPLFVVAISDGHATATQGEVSNRFLRECERISSMYDLTDGRIEGSLCGKRVRLRFSKSIPQEYHQNFRNVFHAMQV